MIVETTHTCDLSFKHSDCSRIEDKGEFIGHVFKNSDGDWMYVDAIKTGPRGLALGAGTTNSRASAINWLRLGRN